MIKQTTNLSKIRRDRMLDTLSEIKKNTTDEMLLNNLALIENELTKKKYGLIWEEHEERVDKELETQIPTFVDVKSKSIISNSNEKFNFLLEGDNLHSLYLLEKTHKGKINVIYIDPPYNTGAKDWKYDNNYVDNNDLFSHSKWLSFMEKRLKIASKLLTDNGILVCTIDNYEVHNLRLLMEETLPNREYIITVIEHNHRGRAKNNFALTHEYAIWAIPTNKDLITRKEEFSKDAVLNLRRTGQNSLRQDRPTMFYGIIVNKKTLKILRTTEPIVGSYTLNEFNIDDSEAIILPIDNTGTERRWYYGAERTLAEAEQGSVFAKKVKDQINVYFKFKGKKVQRKSVWTGAMYDSSSHGTVLLNNILGKDAFSFPKSLYAVKECIMAASDSKDAIILDFFAGSGTTGHAVMELNKEDGGNRQFILCTNNENEICEKITYERIKKVSEGYKGKDPVPINLKYYKTSYIPRINTEKENLHNNLLINIKNLIQLENGIEIDDKEIKVYLDEKELDKFTLNQQELDECNKVYISSDILLTSEQLKIFKDNNIEVFIIPEYYFEDEIMEVA